MLQGGCQMSSFWTLGLVWLMWGFTTVWGSAVGAIMASKNNCHRKTCVDIQYDNREAVCCDNHLYSGTGLSCCGKKSFNPAKATCCKEGHGYNITADITHGLSEAVSACCGLKAYNSLNEICCQSSVIAKPAPMAQCCGKEAFDEDEQICCGPTNNKMILSRRSSHHRCCGYEQYDTKTQCCCFMEKAFQIQPHNSSCCVKNSAPCGTKTHNTFKELFCQSTAVAKPAPNAQRCGKEAFDEDKQICCGPTNNKMILSRRSSHHRCCGYDQYDTKTQCCCFMEKAFQIQPYNASCCVEKSGVQQQKHGHPPNRTSHCGSSWYNPNEYRCCKRNQTMSRWCCASGGCDAAPTLYNASTHVCCDGCLSESKPWIDQCCGETPYGLAQGGVLCCNNTLYKDRKDGEECSDIGTPYDPAEGTICCSQFHGSPGQHCCGTEVYLPHAEICCDGHRHPKVENVRCCGVQAYNFRNEELKCCAGSLYNLTGLGRLQHHVQCCGSALQEPLDTCCSSEDEEVLYSAKTGFRCCGHLYYNTALWSCCAGELSPVHRPGQRQSKRTQRENITSRNESRLLSMTNQNETYLCKEMHVGIVESVSLHSIVFSSVLKIHGSQATVKPLPSAYILKTHEHCNSPKLILGKTYFYDEVNIFIDFNHDSILQSLHFIISKCNHF